MGDQEWARDAAKPEDRNLRRARRRRREREVLPPRGDELRKRVAISRADFAFSCRSGRDRRGAKQQESEDRAKLDAAERFREDLTPIASVAARIAARGGSTKSADDAEVHEIDDAVSRRANSSPRKNL